MARSLGSGTFRHKPSPLDGMFYGKYPPGREPEPYLGFRLPRAADCRFEFSERDYGWMVGCTAGYVTPSDLLMRAHMEIDTTKLLRSELDGLQTYMQHHTLARLRMEVQAHNAVVQPIDNGPEDLVYLAETCYRVKAALADWQLDSDGPDFDELRAACNANTYAGHAAVEYFRNLNPQE